MFSLLTSIFLFCVARQQNSLAARPDCAVTFLWQEELLIVPRLLRKVGEGVVEGLKEGERDLVFIVTLVNAVNCPMYSQFILLLLLPSNIMLMRFKPLTIVQ